MIKHQVELIVCDDSYGYETEVFVEIPKSLYEARNVDEVAAWVCENVDDIDHTATYIGVYNWNDECEDLL